MRIPDSVERVLLVRLSALGDCLAAVPVFHALRRHFPHAHLSWVIQDNFSPLIRNLPGLDEIILFPRKRWRTATRSRIFHEGRRFLHRLRMRRFDVTVDVQSNTKSGVIAFLTRAPLRIGHGPGEAKELSRWLNNCLISPPPDRPHILQRNLHLLSPLGIEAVEPQFDLPVDPMARQRIVAWLRSVQVREKEYALFAPFSGDPRKEWPRACFSELAGRLAENHLPVIFLCGPGREQETAALLSPASDRIFLAPPTDILELVELIRPAKWVIGGDTGPVQIAGALGVPTIAFFGPTDPNRSHPWGKTCICPLQAGPTEVLEHCFSL